MMDKLRKIYRDFFGLQEQTKTNLDPKQISLYNTQLKQTIDLTNQLKNSMAESDLDEAQLVNNLTDYQGGVEYVLRDSAAAQQTASEIQEWAERKGFTIIKKTISKTGKIGYFYFRLGQDPALESQKLQGYLAQKPELKHFRFNVRQQTPKPSQEKI
ncbi:MAG: hypothetical protein EBT26_07260 [Microbacteriaceae bacterium]|nr:hypothetical protein [Microbacteriaceae bacterium]NBS61818.1 hypothetical protein [Microbacteriaceae bacterium]